MLFQKVFLLIKGYVIVTVEGRHLEKFINLAVSRGYPLWNIYRPSSEIMTAGVPVNVFPHLRHIAKAADCRMKIKSKRGLPFAVLKFRRRKMLFAGAVVFLISLYILSLFIWSVEVKSSGELKLVREEQILEEASKNGLRIGALKPSLNAGRLQRAILYEFPQLSWVGVEIRGTKATIEIVEKILPDKSQSDRRPGNIVAVKDGIIEEILVLSGEAKVAQGDTVRKGDILISGTIFPKEEGEEMESQEAEGEELINNEQQKKEPLLVRARGIVRARVWYEVEKEVPLVEEKDRMTGRKRELLILNLAGKEIILKGKKGIPYKNYRYRKKSWKLPKMGKMVLPAELVSETYWEVEKEKNYRSMIEARNIAVDRAEAELKRRLKPGTKVVEKKVSVKSLEEKRIRAVLIIEALEDITRFVPMKEK